MNTKPLDLGRELQSQHALAPVTSPVVSPVASPVTSPVTSVPALAHTRYITCYVSPSTRSHPLHHPLRHRSHPLRHPLRHLSRHCEQGPPTPLCVPVRRFQGRTYNDSTSVRLCVVVSKGSTSWVRTCFSLLRWGARWVVSAGDPTLAALCTSWLCFVKYVCVCVHIYRCVCMQKCI